MPEANRKSSGKKHFVIDKGQISLNKYKQDLEAYMKSQEPKEKPKKKKRRPKHERQGDYRAADSYIPSMWD